MYCPKCAAQNSDDIKFCRSCGTNLSAVSQVLTGQLQPTPTTTILDGRDQARLSKAIKDIFTGLAFLIVAKVFWVSGHGWGVWMLIPSFACLGKGISEILPLALKYWHLFNPPQAAPQPVLPPVSRTTGELSPRKEFETLPPPSVTENTTRHLETAVERPGEKQRVRELQ